MRYVVTGANRGLGLEFTRQLAARGDGVVAAARDVDAARELRSLAEAHPEHIEIARCDVAVPASVRGLAEQVGERPVDVLINNAGVMGRMQSLEDLDLDDVANTFSVNTLGPVRVVQALLPALRRGKRRIVHVSSGMGSITDNTSGGAYGYRISKAALNMASRSMSVDLAGEGFVCVVMNPGWVQTDMGGKGAPVPVDESIRLMLERIDALAPEHNGAFLNYKGGSYAY